MQVLIVKRGGAGVAARASPNSPRLQHPSRICAARAGTPLPAAECAQVERRLLDEEVENERERERGARGEEEVEHVQAEGDGLGVDAAEREEDLRRGGGGVMAWR